VLGGVAFEATKICVSAQRMRQRNESVSAQRVRQRNESVSAQRVRQRNERYVKYNGVFATASAIRS
jgi:hypothetical protein